MTREIRSLIQKSRIRESSQLELMDIYIYRHSRYLTKKL